MNRFAADYVVKLATEDSPKSSSVRLIDRPLLRWSNQVVREDDAAMYLWTLDDRPLLACQFFRQSNEWHHEFQSLSGQSLTIGYLDGWRWSPSGQEGFWKALVDVEAPRDNPASRLSQMRNIARGYGAKCKPAHLENSEELRLLSTPVYRYACPKEHIVDGAIFAFAQGTNPEVLLMLEAVDERDGKLVWKIAFAPMTSWEARCFKIGVDKAVVWQQDRQIIENNPPDAPYQFRLRVHLDSELK